MGATTTEFVFGLEGAFPFPRMNTFAPAFLISDDVSSLPTFRFIILGIPAFSYSS